MNFQITNCSLSLFATDFKSTLLVTVSYHTVEYYKTSEITYYWMKGKSR